MPDQKTQKVLSSDLKQNNFVFQSVVEKQARINQTLIAVFSVMALAVVSGSFILSSRIASDLEAAEAARQTAENDLELTTKALSKQLLSKKTVLNKIKTAVDDIQKKSYHWSDAIAEIEAITSANISINKITGHYLDKDVKKEGANVINISGETTSYSNIASYIEAIESSEYFSDVKFKSSSKTRRPDRPTKADLKISFAIKNMQQDEDEGQKELMKYAKTSPDAATAQAPQADAPAAPLWDESKMALTTATSPEQGRIRLAWTNTNEDYAFNVYMIEATNKDPIAKSENLIATVKKSDGLNTFYEVEVEDPLKEYKFALQSISKVGVKSELSESIMRIGGIARELDAIQNVVLERAALNPNAHDPAKANFKELVTVKWDVVTDPDFHAYKVYVGTVQNDLNLVETITDQERAEFSRAFPYANADLFVRVVYVDKNGNQSN